MGAHNYDYDDDAALNGVFGREQQRDAEEGREKYGYPNYASPIPAQPPRPVVKKTTKPKKIFCTVELEPEDREKLDRLIEKHKGLPNAIKALIHDYRGE